MNLDFSYDLTTRRYFIKDEALQEILNNYSKLYKIMEVVKNHKPKVKKYIYTHGEWVCQDTEIRQELERIINN